MTVPSRGAGLAVGLLSVVASCLLVWLFARVGSSTVWVGWFALVPFLFALDRTGSWRGALGLGLALGVGFVATVLGWFPAAVQGFAELPPWASWLVFLALAPVLEPQFLTFALARHLARRSAPEGRWTLPRVALTGALVYVGTEWLAPKLLADTLGQGFYTSVSLRQGADLGGAHGLTLALLLANECVLAAVKRLAAGGRAERRRALAPLAVLTALLTGCYGYGFLRYRQVREHILPGTELVVGVVQANITNYDRLAKDSTQYQVLRMVLDTHYAMSDALVHAATPADLILWPETVYPLAYGARRSEDDIALDDEVNAFVSQRHVPLIFGAYDQEDGREFNAAVFLDADPEARPRFTTYRKTKLFPLTEWVPESLDGPRLRQLLPWTGYWKQGPGPRTIPVRIRGGRTILLAPAICYESIFPDHASEEARKGAQLIVTMSNDSWFTGTPGPRYHLMLAAFRSIETRLPQVRATNSGISALLDPTGEILSETSMDQRVGMNVSVPRIEHVGTLMVAWGDWLGPTALTAGMALLGLAILAGRRGKPAKAS